MELTDWAKKHILDGSLTRISNDDGIYITGLTLELERVSEDKFKFTIKYGDEIFANASHPLMINKGDIITIEEDGIGLKMKYKWV